MMKLLLKLTDKDSKSLALADVAHIVAVEPVVNRDDTPAYTNVHLIGGVKLQVAETVERVKELMHEAIRPAGLGLKFDATLN